MPQTLQFRRGDKPTNDNFVGQIGEITVDVDQWGLRIHDGATSGGHPINPVDAYDKTEIDIKIDDINDALGLKVESSDIALKANTVDVYTKTDIDTSLALKAEKNETYTRQYIDDNFTDNNSLATNYYTKTKLGEILHDVGSLTLKETAIEHATATEGQVLTVTGGNVGWAEPQGGGLSNSLPNVISTNTVLEDNTQYFVFGDLSLSAGVTLSAPTDARVYVLGGGSLDLAGGTLENVSVRLVNLENITTQG